MAMDDALTNALYSGGQSYMTGTGYDPRQAGPAPDPRLAPQYGPAQPAPYVPPPNVPRPGGTSLRGCRSLVTVVAVLLLVVAQLLLGVDKWLTTSTKPLIR